MRENDSAANLAILAVRLGVRRAQTEDLLAQFVEQVFGVDEVGGVEAFGEPLVDVS